jgi:hypothetical protein
MGPLANRMSEARQRSNATSKASVLRLATPEQIEYRESALIAGDHFAIDQADRTGRWFMAATTAG